MMTLDDMGKLMNVVANPRGMSVEELERAKDSAFELWRLVYSEWERRRFEGIAIDGRQGQSADG